MIFESTNVTSDVKHAVVADLTQLFSSYTSVVLRVRSSERAAQWHGHVLTHDICELKSGIHTRLGRVPLAVRDYFSFAVTIEGTPHLGISQKLVDAYQTALELKKQHPSIFESLDDFLDLRRNKTRLIELAENPKDIRHRFYYYKNTPPSSEKEYQKEIQDMLSEMNDHSEMNNDSEIGIRKPSLLDIHPLSSLWKKSEISDVLVFVATISFEEFGETDYMLFPISAYANDTWCFFVYPTP